MAEEKDRLERAAEKEADVAFIAAIGCHSRVGFHPSHGCSPKDHISRVLIRLAKRERARAFREGRAEALDEAAAVCSPGFPPRCACSCAVVALSKSKPTKAKGKKG